MVYGPYLLIGFCVYWLVFLICILLVIFLFPYITIVVNLYSTAHGENNKLYKFFFCFPFGF
jgi:hypothetical protein